MVIAYLKILFSILVIIASFLSILIFSRFKIDNPKSPNNKYNIIKTNNAIIGYIIDTPCKN